MDPRPTDPATRTRPRTPTPTSQETLRSRAFREFPQLERRLLPALRTHRIRRARARIRRLPRLPRALGVTAGPWLVP